MNVDPRPAPRPAEAEAPDEAAAGAARRFLSGGGVSQAERDLLLRAERLSEEETARLRNRISHYERLVESARALSTTLDIDRLIDLILEKVVDLFGVDRGFLLLGDDERGLALKTGHDRLAGRLTITKETEISRSLAVQAFREGRLVYVSNALEREEFRLQRSIQDLRLMTIVCVPMRARHGTIGVLYLDSRSPDALFPLEDRAILEAFSAHAAVAIENARLHRDLADAREGLEKENRQLRRSLPGAMGIGSILGTSSAVDELRHRIGQLQEVESPVLVLGESGTGKELVARAIHAGSPRASERFQVFDCTSVPRELMEGEIFGHRRGAFTGAHRDKQGLFEAADRGTLFLDEIGELSFDLQSKLLRVLERGEFRRVGETDTRSVDVRILSATNRDLESMIRQGLFREDLYYRLKVIMLRIPPLRERGEDAILLAEHFLRKNLDARGRAYTGFTPAAVRLLREYDWPGNVRELANAIEGACAFLPTGRPIDEADLRLIFRPPGGRGGPAPKGLDEESGLRRQREDSERSAVVAALEQSGWVVARAARRLGISRQHLHNRIRHFGLRRPEERPLAQA